MEVGKSKLGAWKRLEDAVTVQRPGVGMSATSTAEKDKGSSSSFRLSRVNTVLLASQF